MTQVKNGVRLRSICWKKIGNQLTSWDLAHKEEALKITGKRISTKSFTMGKK